LTSDISKEEEVDIFPVEPPMKGRVIGSPAAKRNPRERGKEQSRQCGGRKNPPSTLADLEAETGD
jgi:hypothetical protein